MLIDFEKYRDTLEVNDEDYEPSKYPEPTGIPPGPRKVSVLRARVDAGERLWNPDDADHAGSYIGGGDDSHVRAQASPSTIRRYSTRFENGKIICDPK
jgi:hypothetical protein